MRRPDARPLAPIAAAGALALALTSFAAAEPGLNRGDDPLRHVEDAIAAEEQRLQSLTSQSQDLGAEMDRLQQQLVDYAGQVQQREAELAELDQQVIMLETTRAAKLAGLENQRSDLGALVAVLQRLSMQPREALILGFQSPQDMVLSAELLNYALPGLQAKATRLKQELADIQSLRENAEKQRREIATAAESLRGVREGIKRLVAQKASLRRVTEEDRAAAHQRVEELARQADDLRELLEAMPAMPRAPEIKPEIGSAATAPTVLRLEPPKDLKGFPRKRDGLSLRGGPRDGQFRPDCRRRHQERGNPIRDAAGSPGGGAS